jgi:hypothetical protein
VSQLSVLLLDVIVGQHRPVERGLDVMNTSIVTFTVCLRVADDRDVDWPWSTQAKLLSAQRLVMMGRPEAHADLTPSACGVILTASTCPAFTACQARLVRD